MRLKIIISFLVLNFLCGDHVFSQEKDSIRQVSLSDKTFFDPQTNQIELAPFEFPFFDADRPQLFVKVELFRNVITDTSHFIYLEIKKKSLQQFRLRPIVSKKIPISERTVYIDSLPLPDSIFASGNFDVIVNFMHDSFKVADVMKVPFQLLRSSNAVMRDEFYTVAIDKTSNEVNIDKTFVAKYSVEQLQKNIQALGPLAKGTEIKVIKDVSMSEDVESLRRFFYNFWLNQNPADPELSWNNYALILNDVAKKYGNASTPGYESDRGRILIQYGQPDKIVRIINEKNAKPYEVWFYYRSGVKTNVKFLFYQPGILGSNMFLLHSNQSEEVINPYWKVMLLDDAGSGDNKLTHKVFEYFND